AHQPGLYFYVLGLGFFVFGAAATTLHLTASDAFLHRHFGDRGAEEVRRAGRQGWVPMLLGLLMLGTNYWMRWAEAKEAEAKFARAFLRGASAAKARDWPKAADAFSEAIRLDPGSAKAYRNRGVALLAQGDHDGALEDLGEAIRLDPADA